MNIIDADLIALAKAGEFDVIAHGCNCMNTMGAGLALSIKRAFPAAHAADQKTVKGDRGKLGTCTEITVEGSHGPLVVVNAYTQFDYRGRGVRVDYDAIGQCMAWIKHHHAGKRIGLPLIGAGLAGGDWPTIEAIIARELADEDVTIVRYLASP